VDVVVGRELLFLHVLCAHLHPYLIDNHPDRLFRGNSDIPNEGEGQKDVPGRQYTFHLPGIACF
jgi:hypothetical protein